MQAKYVSEKARHVITVHAISNCLQDVSNSDKELVSAGFHDSTTLHVKNKFRRCHDDARIRRPSSQMATIKMPLSSTNRFSQYMKALSS
jgi:hypothetical protein